MSLDQQDEVLVPCCRFCFDTEDGEDDPLITPCDCSGTQNYVHQKCILKWQLTQLNDSLQNGSLRRNRLVPQPPALAHSKCGVCGAEFRDIPIPDRKVLLENYCGEEVVGGLQNYTLLVASRTSSERSVPVIENRMLMMLLNMNRSHWKHSVYFIYSYEVTESNEYNDIRALNFTRHMEGSAEKPIPDEVLLAQDACASWATIRHYNGGPVNWSSVRHGLCSLNLSLASVQAMVAEAAAVSASMEVDGEIGDVADAPSMDRNRPTASSLEDQLTRQGVLLARRAVDDGSDPVAGPAPEQPPPIVEGNFVRLDAGEVILIDRSDDNGDSVTLRCLLMGKFTALMRFLSRHRGALEALLSVSAVPASTMPEEPAAVETPASNASADAGANNSFKFEVFSFSGYAQWNRLQLLNEIYKGSWGISNSPTNGTEPYIPAQVLVRPPREPEPDLELEPVSATDPASDSEEDGAGAVAANAAAATAAGHRAVASAMATVAAARREAREASRALSYWERHDACVITPAHVLL